MTVRSLDRRITTIERSLGTGQVFYDFRPVPTDELERAMTIRERYGDLDATGTVWRAHDELDPEEAQRLMGAEIRAHCPNVTAAIDKALGVSDE